MIPTELSRAIKTDIGEIQQFQPVGGGCINHGGKILIDDKPYFLKWNDAEAYPGMFEAEQVGLELLDSSSTVSVPKVVQITKTETFQGLLLEWVEHANQPKITMVELGNKLAQLHQTSNAGFGLSSDNYIGSLPQRNSFHDSWVEFFISQRCEPLIKIALDSNYLNTGDLARFQNLYKILNSIIPEEPPALLHGDLWSGNILSSPRGYYVLDPAVYYGHREMDIAFTRMFGGFDAAFYSGYENVFPFQPGFEDRIDLHNIYPLLVHVNLFGGGYVAQLQSALRRYT